MAVQMPGKRFPSLLEKVQFLSSLKAYGLEEGEVRSVETHMSWVFLTGTRAYKLKKPVRYPFLDFTTPCRRRHYCAAEVRLNQRLAGDVYRRIVPLRKDLDGRLSLHGDGEIVDWLVEMEQLAAGDMMDAALRRGAVTRDQVVAVAEKLGRFYAAARPRLRNGRLYLTHLFAENEVNRWLLSRPSGLAAERTADLIERTDRLLRVHTPAIRARIAAGRIVEGHGDLRPEHVCLEPHPIVIDCLEFDLSMRLLDPYDEVNYLGLECERLGGVWIRGLLLDVLERFIGNRPDPRLIATYGAFRALLRARLCMAHLLDPKPSRPEHWPAEARRYLDVAERECLIGEGGAVDGSGRPRGGAGSFRSEAERS